jgi:hypothetical protein
MWVILFFIANSALAVCGSPIARTNVGFQNVLTSAKYNSDLNTAFNRANNLPGDCIIDGTIGGAKLQDGAITNAKLANGAITSEKLASGAIPEAGRLIRMASFTASGTWTKQSDVGSILVQVVGGGGASFHASSTNGGNSSFGSHCTANGGQKPANGSVGTEGGAGGTATGGDINLVGGLGERLRQSAGAYLGAGPGYSMLGQFGRGGIGALPDHPSAGGGAGGYCAKVITASALASTETVTIGAGGTNPGAGTTPGLAGIVIIYEYSK